MKRFLAALVVLILGFFAFIPKVLAVENPLSVPNNKFGIHILFPSELSKASDLVNSNNGNWGYVVIPIQSGDKDIVKWQTFMDDCRKYHLIPIIRLATEGDYFNTKVWRKPNVADVLDFANFLNSLNWPVKNRYIIVYNEVNRGDEWGGIPSPSEYANLLSYAVTVFKARSSDFFIISAGMDNAAATTNIAINEYDFLREMNQAVPGIFNQIDGIDSHSYPNPAFSQPPTIISKESITSFQFERQLISQLTLKNLPTFITETGWAQDVVGQDKAAQYLSSAYQTVWNTDNVAVVAPFLLQAGSGPFTPFTFLDANGAPNAVFKAIVAIPKIQGAPVVNPPTAVLAANINPNNLPIKYFMDPLHTDFAASFETGVKKAFKFLLGVK